MNVFVRIVSIPPKGIIFSEPARRLMEIEPVPRAKFIYSKVRASCPRVAEVRRYARNATGLVFMR